MKSALAASLFVLACVSAAEIPDRQLQFFPQGNGRGPFRPAPPAQGQLNVGNQANGANPPGVNANTGFGESAVAGNAEPTGVNVVEADAAVAPPAAAPTATIAADPAATTVVPTTGDIAPGQPTIMVILPDFMAAGSGWATFSDDTIATPATPTETPKEAQSAAVATSRGLAVAAGALSMALAAAL